MRLIKPPPYPCPSLKGTSDGVTSSASTLIPQQAPPCVTKPFASGASNNGPIARWTWTAMVSTNCVVFLGTTKVAVDKSHSLSACYKRWTPGVGFGGHVARFFHA